MDEDSLITFIKFISKDIDDLITGFKKNYDLIGLLHFDLWFDERSIVEPISFEKLLHEFCYPPGPAGDRKLNLRFHLFKDLFLSSFKLSNYSSINCSIYGKERPIIYMRMYYRLLSSVFHAKLFTKDTTEALIRQLLHEWKEAIDTGLASIKIKIPILNYVFSRNFSISGEKIYIDNFYPEFIFRLLKDSFGVYGSGFTNSSILCVQERVSILFDGFYCSFW